MPKYDELHTTAFRLVPSGLHQVGGALGVLTFPREWLTPILDLQQQDRPQQRAIPIAAVNTAIRALVPDVAAVTRGVGRREHSGHWLYCAGQPDLAGIALVVRAWLLSTVKPARADDASDLWTRLESSYPLSWETADATHLDLAGRSVAPDTPEATEALGSLTQELFHLVPEVLAAELLRRSDRPEGFPRGFRRCPTTSGAGVELMSWPPLEHHGAGGRRWPFSYRVRLTVQTAPFQPEPMLHVTTGLRRWCRTAPSTRAGQSVNAYLLTDVPWFRGLPHSRSFRVAPLRWSKTDDGWVLRWRNELRDLFDQITFDRELPDPIELTADPLKYLSSLGEDRAAAIVHSTSGGNRHGVGAGVSARDRDRLTRWIGNTLNDMIVPAKPLPRVRISLAGSRDLPPHKIRARIAELATDRRLTVEIYRDSQQVADALQSAVAADLGLDNVSPKLAGPGGLTIWETPELTVAIKLRSIGALGAPLELNSRIRDQRVRAKKAANPRIEAVHAATEPTSGTTLAVVELRGPDAFRDPGADPKAALRVGYARTGRLTQFLTPGDGSTDNLEHRAASAWADLRRQLVGSLEPVHPRVRGLDLPHPVDTIAIYVLRRNAASRYSVDRHQLPIAVWTSSDSPEVWARTLRMDTWRPYHEVLLELASGQAFTLPDRKPVVTQSFISEVLTSLRHDRPAMLLTWAQNLRLDWHELQNKHVIVDQPKLAGRPLTGIAPNLRHVLVRTRQFDETPECYGIDDDRVGLPSGLFRSPTSHRLFASIAQKPASAQSHGSPMGSRVEGRVNARGREVVETAKNAYNPQYIELAVAALQEGDDPLAWATLAHAQRTLSDAYNDTLTLPLPLHFAQKATEYAIPDATVEDGAPDELPDQQDEGPSA